MSLSPGTRLGPYQILAPIGAGGMGQVWKARDTRLDRTVAVKVSAAQFSERFEREARAVAALNHPHICTLHDVGPDYLVMEYVDGKPLAGPLPLDEGLRYAIQIAEALDAAHRKGIVHRDLKPANILVTKTGIKLLDFGLAKTITRTIPEADATVTQALTKENTILGTLQYMAPEQLQGKEADTRSDIFSFGAVLYEIFSGRRAFEGSNAASLITAVMSTQPPAVSPPSLDRLIAACMAKDPDERFQNIHDVLIELRWLSSAPEQTAVPLPPARRSSWWPAAASVFLLAALTLAWMRLRETPAEPPVMRFAVNAPAKSGFSPTRQGEAEISPDGLSLVFLAAEVLANDGEGNALWIRRLDSSETHRLVGTEGATYPFWSEDSRQVGFFADRKLKRVAIEGGPPQTICAAQQGRGGTWHGGADGLIVFAANNREGLSRVAAGGGEPVLVTALDSAHHEITHRVPHFLPDGRHFLYVAASDEVEKTRVMVGELPSGSGKPAPATGKPLFENQTEVRWTPPGYVLFVREGNLMARPFDARQLELTGEPVPLAENIDTGGNRYTAAFSVSASGVLTYRRSASLATRMVWLDRQGKEVEQIPAGDNILYPVVSPDGTMAAGARNPIGLGDMWLVNLVRGTASRFTFDPRGTLAWIWSPDGKSIVYAQRHGGGFDLYLKDVGGVGEPELLLQSHDIPTPTDWSHDGKWIFCTYLRPETGFSIAALPVTGDRKPIELVASKFVMGGASPSPDGRYFAYDSDESGRKEVYVRTFSPGSPSAGGKWQVSNGAGSGAEWRGDGNELYYGSADRKVMAVPVHTGQAFQAGTPAALFDLQRDTSMPSPRADGQRFLAAVPVQGAAQEPQQVVVNWPATLPDSRRKKTRSRHFSEAATNVRKADCQSDCQSACRNPSCPTENRD